MRCQLAYSSTYCAPIFEKYVLSKLKARTKGISDKGIISPFLASHSEGHSSIQFPGGAIRFCASIRIIREGIEIGNEAKSREGQAFEDQVDKVLPESASAPSLIILVSSLYDR